MNVRKFLKNLLGIKTEESSTPKCKHDWVFCHNPYIPHLCCWKCTKCGKQAYQPEDDKGIQKLIDNCKDHEFVLENKMVMDAYLYHCSKCGKPMTKEL